MMHEQEESYETLVTSDNENGSVIETKMKTIDDVTANNCGGVNGVCYEVFTNCQDTEDVKLNKYQVLSEERRSEDFYCVNPNLSREQLDFQKFGHLVPAQYSGNVNIHPRTPVMSVPYYLEHTISQRVNSSWNVSLQQSLQNSEMDNGQQPCSTNVAPYHPGYFMESDGMFHERNCTGDGELDNFPLEQSLSDIQQHTTGSHDYDGELGMTQWNYSSGAEVPTTTEVPNENYFHCLQEVDGRSMMPISVGVSPGATVNDTSMSEERNRMGERFSRKVFIGGLPPDIVEEEIAASFLRFGQLRVDWPPRNRTKGYFPPKGFCFIYFLYEAAVQELVEACIEISGKLLYPVSSPSIKDRLVQIRPWSLSDGDYVINRSIPLDERKTVFVGGLPRYLKAVELAFLMAKCYGGVCYAGIDTDSTFKYPKGAGRVVFFTEESYIAAISMRFIGLELENLNTKMIEVKPYVLDSQLCDECGGGGYRNRFAPLFCPSVDCLLYLCEHCWMIVHSRPGLEYHRPCYKDGPCSRRRRVVQM